MYSSNQEVLVDSICSAEDIQPLEPQLPKAKNEEPRLKQRLSNRTGGPNTPEGKSKSAQNSIKHGGYSLSPRSREEFAKFEQQVFGFLEPSGAIQTQLVSRIAFTMWKTKLIQRYVDEAHDSVETDDVSYRQLACLTEFPFAARYQYQLNVNETDDVRQRRLAKFWSSSYELLSNADEADALILAGDDRIREIHREGIEVLGQRYVNQLMNENFFNALDRVMNEALECRNSIGLYLDRIDDLTELVNYWIYRKSLKLSAARRQIREELALRILCDPKIDRALSNSDSALQKQLNVYWLIKDKQISSASNLYNSLLTN
jgi:hypothetical protein